MQTEVYFSSLIKDHNIYGNYFEKIIEILDRNRVGYDFIEGTKDIWCRDYMPVRDGKDKLVQFQFEPSYLKGFEKLKTITDDIRVQGAVPTHRGISLNMDGGNFVRKGNKVMISDRIFDENKLGSKASIVDSLEKFLHLEVIITPALSSNDDMTGHSDGYARFVHEHLVLVSSLQNEHPDFRDAFKAVFKKHHLEWTEMPSFLHEDPRHKNSAIGCYVNYLELEDIIIFPIFEIHARTDEQALKVIRKFFPNKKVEPVVINDIANDGGLMHCISWQG